MVAERPFVRAIHYSYSACITATRRSLARSSGPIAATALVCVHATAICFSELEDGPWPTVSGIPPGQAIAGGSPFVGAAMAPVVGCEECLFPAPSVRHLVTHRPPWNERLRISRPPRRHRSNSGRQRSVPRTASTRQTNRLASSHAPRATQPRRPVRAADSTVAPPPPPPRRPEPQQKQQRLFTLSSCPQTPSTVRRRTSNASRLPC